MSEQILYVVLRLNTTVEYIDPMTRKTEYTKLGGCVGFMPVYATLEEAESIAGDKYQILPIKTYEPDREE